MLNFNTYQTTYKNHHFIETVLVKITNDILNAVDQKMAIVLTLLDFSTAFETIDHRILLDVLSSYFDIKGMTQISGLTLVWIIPIQTAHIYSTCSYSACFK